MEYDKISVIVTVYNLEQYIEECIESILTQSYSWLEIILVDDGSTDSSGEICDEYAKKDNRVRVLHKENGGVTQARKAGIEQATGEYIMFIDGDDWIEKDTCQKTLDIAKTYGVDIVRFSIITEEGSKKSFRVDDISVGKYDSSNMVQLISRLIWSFDTGASGTNNSLCSQLTKTAVIKKFYKKVSDEIKYGEDFAYVVSALLESDSTYITDLPLYHYRMRQTSVTHNSNPYYYLHVNLLYLYLQEISNCSQYKDMLLPQLERYCDELILRGLNHRFIISRDIRIPEYMIALDKIPTNSKIVIYGAGAVGVSLYKFLSAVKSFCIVGWVDKNWSECKKAGIMADEPKKILEHAYDFVLVAVQNEKLYQTIYEELVKDYGVNPQKIIWKKPIHVLDFF